MFLSHSLSRAISKTVLGGRKETGKWFSGSTLITVPKIPTHFKIHFFSSKKKEDEKQKIIEN